MNFVLVLGGLRLAGVASRSSHWPDNVETDAWSMTDLWQWHATMTSDELQPEPRLSRWVAVLLSFIAFVVVFEVVAIIPLMYLSYVLGEEMAAVLSCILSLPLAYYVARKFYNAIRWKRCQGLTKECQNCSYNLTGNVSGICPECGTPVAPASSAD